MTENDQTVQQNQEVPPSNPESDQVSKVYDSEKDAARQLNKFVLNGSHTNDMLKDMLEKIPAPSIFEQFFIKIKPQGSLEDRLGEKPQPIDCIALSAEDMRRVVTEAPSVVPIYLDYLGQELNQAAIFGQFEMLEYELSKLERKNQQSSESQTGLLQKLRRNMEYFDITCRYYLRQARFIRTFLSWFEQEGQPVWEQQLTQLDDTVDTEHLKKEAAHFLNIIKEALAVIDQDVAMVGERKAFLDEARRQLLVSA